MSKATIPIPNLPPISDRHECLENPDDFSLKIICFSGMPHMWHIYLPFRMPHTNTRTDIFTATFYCPYCGIRLEPEDETKKLEELFKNTP